MNELVYGGSNLSINKQIKYFSLIRIYIYNEYQINAIYISTSFLPSVITSVIFSFGFKSPGLIIVAMSVEFRRIS